MTRTPTEVLTDHLKALNSHDADAVVADYAPDAVLILPGAAIEGAEAVKAAFAETFVQLPNAVFSEKSITESGGTILLEWTLEADTATATDGIDTIVVRDGLIVAQTARFTPQPR
ncbi:nuclear transport factor 2 family protein [Pseudonocardia pini]|uniref:nuclear transport factor 2 family protein n=1 Tax=Pseudonocardia pini TaxID=2758030 RepID=UPI0015F00C20|nr:nuclear transport factor 2 family protein [Pseudonocardia pini]